MWKTFSCQVSYSLMRIIIDLNCYSITKTSLYIKFQSNFVQPATKYHYSLIVYVVYFRLRASDRQTVFCITIMFEFQILHLAYKNNGGSWIRKWLTRIWQKLRQTFISLCALASKRRGYLYLKRVKRSRPKFTCTGSLRCCAVSKRMLCASSNNFSIWGSVQESMHFDFQNSSSTNSSR